MAKKKKKKKKKLSEKDIIEIVVSLILALSALITAIKS